MSGGDYWDGEYTFVPKPSAPSYTVSAKPTATYTVVPTPRVETLAILTEASVMITEEDRRVLVVEGTL